MLRLMRLLADDSLANLTLLDANTNHLMEEIIRLIKNEELLLRLMQKGNLYLFVRVMCF